MKREGAQDRSPEPPGSRTGPHEVGPAITGAPSTDDSTPPCDRGTAEAVIPGGAQARMSPLPQSSAASPRGSKTLRELAEGVPTPCVANSNRPRHAQSGTRRASPVEREDPGTASRATSKLNRRSPRSPAHARSPPARTPGRSIPWDSWWIRGSWCMASALGNRHTEGDARRAHMEGVCGRPEVMLRNRSSRTAGRIPCSSKATPVSCWDVRKPGDLWGP